MKPTIQIDMEQLETMMRWKPTLKDCAAFFKCSTETVERRIFESTGQGFKEFRDAHLVPIKSQLVNIALMRATRDKDPSDYLLVFCLKNLCDWREKQPDEDAPAAIINNNTMAVSEERLIELIRAARGPKK